VIKNSSSPNIPEAKRPIARVVWDVGQIVRNFRFWFFLAWLEVRQQYRRSSLGPFWITLTTAAYVASLVIVFGILFKIRSDDYAPWVTLGVITWNMIVACMGDAGLILISKKQLLSQRQISHNGLVLVSVLKAFFVFLHQIPIFLGVMLYFNLTPTIYTSAILLTLPLLVLVLHPLALIIAYLSARLRDIPPLVTAVLTPLFFVTPIMWAPSQLADKAWIADLNPFAAMIGIIREPLLGRPVPSEMLLLVLGTGLALWLVAFAMQIRFRRRIMYWA